MLLFTADRCSYCRQTRALLRSLAVQFQELNVQRSARAMAQFRQLGGRGVPVVLIGAQRIEGFQPTAIRRALQRVGLAS